MAKYRAMVVIDFETTYRAPGDDGYALYEMITAIKKEFGPMQTTAVSAGGSIDVTTIVGTGTAYWAIDKQDET